MGRNALRTADETLSFIKVKLNEFIENTAGHDDPWDKGFAMGLLEIKKFLTKTKNVV